MKGPKLPCSVPATPLAGLPGESVDSLADTPGVEKRHREDPEGWPQRPVFGDVRQRELQQPLRADFFRQDALPGNSEVRGLANEILRATFLAVRAHRPHREITWAVIAWLEGGFSARPREWSSS